MKIKNAIIILAPDTHILIKDVAEMELFSSIFQGCSFVTEMGLKRDAKLNGPVSQLIAEYRLEA